MNIKISNIKNIKELDLKADNVSLIIAKGKNRIGKTTLSQCLRAVITTEAMKNAVTTGEENGKVTYQGKTIDNDDIVVNWVSSESGDKFTATVIKGDRTIRTQKKADIRALTGQFFKYSSDEIFNLLSTEPGKKKFIKEFILSFLSDDQYKEYERLSKLLSKTDSDSYYNERTEVNRRLKDLESILSKSMSVQWNPKELERLNEAIKLHDKLEYLRSQYSKDQNSFGDIVAEIKGKLRRLSNQFSSDIKIDDCVDKVEETIVKYFNQYFENLQNHGQETKEKLVAVDSRTKSEIENDKTELLASKRVTEQLSSQREEFGRLQKRSEELDRLISETRESLSDVIKLANLPTGLSVVDGSIYLNDMPFQFDSISDSEARIMITELLCVINTSKFVDIGDVTIFDSESLSKIIEIAKKHDCMLIAQKVTDDQKLKIEYDVQINESNN